MMNKEQKKNYISEMATQFENSKAVMVTHYQGLTMPQLDELRAKMRVPMRLKRQIGRRVVCAYDNASCCDPAT